MLAQTTTEPHWEICVVDNDYEIYSEYPYPIRKKSTGRVIKESLQTAGYVRVKLNKKDTLKHRIIGFQWLPNDDPEHKTQIDHINDHDRTNNHIENLQWTTPSKNNDNKTRYNGKKAFFSDQLSEYAIPVTKYNDHTFESLYFDPESDSFWYYTNVAYREIEYHTAKSGSYYVQRADTKHARTKIYLDKFKKMHNLD